MDESASVVRYRNSTACGSSNSGGRRKQQRVGERHNGADRASVGGCRSESWSDGDG